MSQWVINGICRGIKTTAYPNRTENALGTTPGLPEGGQVDHTSATALVECCPTNALSQTNGGVSVDYGRVFTAIAAFGMSSVR